MHLFSILKRLWLILSPVQRRSAVWVFMGLMLGTVLEAIAIGAVVPAMMTFTGAPASDAMPYLPAKVRHIFDNGGEWIVVYGFAALLMVFLFKAVILVGLAWQQARFLSDIRQDVASRLAETYLRQPWTFHLQRNTSQLIRNCTTEVIMFMNGCSGTLSILAESCVTLGIVLLLVTFEPVATLLVTGFLVAATWLLYHTLGRRLKRWGGQRQAAEELRVKWLQQAFGGVREVKVYGREEEFLNHFSSAEKTAARAIRMSDFTNRIPRIWYELIAVAGISLVGTTLFFGGVPMAAIVPRLGLFAVAAFRLLPCMNRIVSALNSVQFMEPAIDVLSKELALPVQALPRPSRAHRSFNTKIQIDDVCYAYPGANINAIDSITCAIPCGASVGIIGESGAGKSTLVDLLLGLLMPAQGRITVDEQDIRTDLRTWQTNIGYVPQSIFLMDDSIRANVAFGVPGELIDDRAVHAAIRAAQLDKFVATLPSGVETVIGERGVRLSGGQRQRIGIARALYWDPPILFLDEATSALDTQTERQVMAGVEALHGIKTLIIIAHRLSTVQSCDVLFRLDGGRLVETVLAAASKQR